MRKYFLLTLSVFVITINGFSQSGSVLRLSTVQQGVIDPPPQSGAFGISVTAIGDLNGDGVEDIAVGARNLGPSSNRGMVYILFMDTNAAVIDTTKIGFGLSGFNQSTGFEGNFGEALAYLGDIDGDGYPELAVGNPFNNGQGSNEGVVWILSLKSDGNVQKIVKIGEGEGGFSGSIDNDENFGISLASMHDVDNDGVPELLVGAPGKSVNASKSGRVYLLRLNANGTVKDYVTYDNSNSLITFSGGVRFGQSLASTNDIDGNGIAEILVGVPLDNVVNGKTRGSVALLFLDSQLSIDAINIINDKSLNFPVSADSVGRYGYSVTNLGDIDGDSFDDIAIGALEGEITPDSTNLILILFLNSQGKIKTSTILKASSGTPFSPFSVPDIDFSGRSLAIMHDINGDGKRDLIAGAPAFNSGEGQIHILTLDGISHIGNPEYEKEAPEVSLYPNPSTGRVKLSFGDFFQSQKLSLQFLDYSGKVLLSRDVAPAAGEIIELDVPLPAGHYLLKITGAKETVTRKVVINP